MPCSHRVGTILTELLDVYPASNITVSIRKEAQRDLFKPLGVNIAVGDYSDVRYLSKLASENDIVINYAVAFGGDEPAIQAIVEALEERAQHAVVKPVYIHSGGTGTVMYGLNGEAGTDTWTVRTSCPPVSNRYILRGFYYRTRTMNAGTVCLILLSSTRDTRCKSAALLRLNIV